MYKMVVSKFEDALIDKEEVISASTVIEIDNIRRRGIPFVIFTEGCLNDILDYNIDFPFIDYIISYGGAYLYDVVDNRVIYKKNLTKKVISTIAYHFSYYDIYGFTENEKILIDKIGDQKIYKLVIKYSNKGSLNDIERQLNELKLNIHFDIKKCGKSYLVEIISGYASKNVAVEKICDIKKIKLEEVVAIGVDDRDISLLKTVGCPVAMENGSSQVKKIAKIITKSNDDGGVKSILNKLEL